nr:capsid protein [uncultured Trichococcus sp.]
MAIKLYTKQYAGMLPELFAKKSAFLRAFGGTIQTLQGAEADANFLNLKTTDTDVVIQAYSTGAAVAFGAGTGNTNRFGVRKEVKSTDTQVPFDTPLAIHEGIDNFTVNDIPEQVVAERLALHAVAWAENYDGVMSATISSSASATLTETELSETGVTNAFAEAHKKFVNNNVSNAVAWVAYVTADVYNFLIDSKLATTAKNSSANVDEQTLYKFKGFELVELPDAKFQTGDNVYFVADGVGVAGVAIPVARTMDSEDFAGVALQAAGKLGKYIPDKNKKAILKAKLVAIPAG